MKNNIRFVSKLLFQYISFGWLIMFVTNETLAAWGSPVRGKQAMVASQQKLASEIGAEIMRNGGNAVDAAVAVGFALAVVYPDAGNIGGGGFMMIRFADGCATAIDYRETAPASATREMFIGENGALIKGEGSSTVGYRAAATPGTVAGLEFALKKYGSGKFTWAQLIEPARRLAANGFVLSNFYAELLKEYQKNLSAYPESKRIFLNNGKFYKWGETLRQPELAATLNRLQEFGARDFYTGATAKLIADDMKRNGGLVTLDDLKKYSVIERTPQRGNYRGYEIVSMPPPSSGAIVLSNVLNILEGYDIRAMGWASSEKYHVLIEAFRRAYADRAVFIADPDFGEIPVEKLISKNYAAERRKTIDLTRASKSSEVLAGEISGKEGMETTHYTIVDPAGNVVSNTYTVNDLFGSGATVKGAGFLLNDIMDDFTAQPGKPNLWGILQGERNRIEPYKRPLSSMSPTIVLRKDGKLWFSVGARGGPTIISAVAQILINIIDHDMNLQQAIDAPRLHHQWFPDEIKHEPFGISADTRRELEKRGHIFAEKPDNIASATGIMIDPKTNDRLGSIDSRRDGEAVGY